MMLSMIGQVVGQATDSPGLDIGKIVAQAGVAGAAVVWALRAEKRAEAAEARQAASEERERQALKDQREILERLVPVVIAGTEAAKEMQRGVARSVEYVRETEVQSLPRDLRTSLDRINQSLESLDERLPGGKKGH